MSWDWEAYKKEHGIKSTASGQDNSSWDWEAYKQAHDVTQNRDLRTERQKYQDPDYLRYKERLTQIDQQAAQMTDRRVLNEMRAGLTIEKPNDYMKAEAAYAQRSNRAEQDMTLAAERYAAAKQYGDRFSTGRYAGDWNKAYNQQLRAGDKLAADYQSIYNADMDRLKQENPGVYYGTTMSGDDLTQRIEAMKANLEKLDAQRAELSRQQNEQTNRNPEYDYGKGSSVSSEEDIRALADRRNTNIQRIGDMIAGLDKRREELQRQIDEYDVGLKYQAQQRGAAIEKEYLEDGRLNTPEVREMAALGQKRYEADRTRALKGARAKLAAMVQEQVAQGRQIGGMTRSEFLKAQEDQGVDVTLDLAANLRPEDAQVFFALYAGDPEKAKEWIKYISLKRDREYQQSVAEQAKSQGWLGTVPNFVGGTTARMISGVLNVADPYGPAATQYARYSQGLLQGGGEFLNEKLPEIPENVPIIGGKGAGDVYQLLSSVAESQTVAAIAAASGNYAGAISALGVMLMGSSAAVSDYNDSVQNGLTREQATQHALAAGIAEAAFEYLSIENLVNWSDFSNTLTSRIKLWLTQGGVEASEEFFTTIANRISDGVLARQNGYDTSVEQRMKELMALGVDRDEARKTAEEEWVTELLNDAIGGFVSGNLSSGVQMITDFGLSRYRDVRDSRQYQNDLEQRGADITTAEEAQALQSFAQANGIQVDDSLISGVEARSQTEAKQAELAGKSTLEQQAEKISENKQTRRERKQEQKSNRSLGTLQQQTVSRIAENVRQAGLANAQTVYDEQVGKHGEGIGRSVQAAVARVAADQFGAATTQEALNAKYNQAIQGVTAQPVREAIQSAYNAKTVELARGGDQSAFGRLVQQYGNSKGSLNLDVQVKNENGTEQTAQIVGVTNNAESVKLSNGQTVKVSELAGIDADTKDVLDRIAYMEVGAAAGNMWQAFQISAEKRTTADNYRWIMDYTTAFDQGRVGKLSLNEAISRSSLDSDIVRMAYELGQQAAKEQTAADKRKLDEKRKAVKPGATGKKGILDASAISEKTMKGLSRQHKQQLQIIEKIAEALGVDVVLYDSTVKDGKYQGANGYYDPKTGRIHLDINAGRNSIRDIGSGILAVTGHELTHWMQEYAPEQYAAYRDAVVKALVSTEGETGFEYLVNKARRDSTKKLTRTQAIDEVVADASMNRMGDEDFWNDMADSLGEEKQGVVAKIRQFFSEWFAKIREALAGSPHISEAARAVDRAEAQVQKALGKLYAEGISEAARTAREIGADATTLGASNQMIEDALVQHSDRIDEETLNFLVAKTLEGEDVSVPFNVVTPGLLEALRAEGVKIEEKNADKKFSSRSTDEAYMEAVNSGDMETAQRMVEEAAKAGGWTIHAYHGTSRADRVGNVFRADRATSGPMAYFTSSKNIADHYAKDKRDTSMAYDTDYDSYETQFRAKTQKGAKFPIDTKIERAWGYIDIAKRKEIREKAGQLRNDWDGDDDTAFILDPKNKEANGGFQWQLQMAKGNAIKALIEQWLNSGNLFNDEARFLEVLKMVGITDELKRVGLDVEYKDPEYREEKTYDVFLKLTRPFNTSKVNQRFIENFLKWADKQPSWKYQRESMSADMWDKNDVTAEDFAERLRNDIENDYTHAWTAVPDVVTDYLKHLGYDGIVDKGGKFHPEEHTVYIPFSSEQIKSAEPVVYDDQDNVIPLSERFNPEKEDIRYQERDYSQRSDLELMAEAAETLSEASGEEYWKALLNSVPELAENEGGVKSRMQEIKRLAQKLSETEKKLEAAKADMKPTDRKLNTSGISAMVKDAMKSFEITDAKKNGIVQKATKALIDGYQQALDAIDAGKSDQIPDITYNAAVKAAEILLTEGRHTENHGGKWSNTTAERYLGEDRQQLIDHMVSAVGADFALNRYRKAIQQTTADRLISRTKNEMQKKLDAQKEKGEALTAENAKLTNENEWLKAAADTAKEQVGSLNDQLQYLKEKMQDAGKLSTKEKAKLRQQARNLNKRLQAAKEESKAWKTRAEQEGKLATQYGEKQAALIKKLEDQKAREQAILEGKLKPLPMQRMLKAVREAEAEKVKQHKDEVFSRYKENQKQAQLRSRIRNLSDEMKRTMTKPTDGSYVPAALYGSMTKLADTLDSLLAPNDGTKAAVRYRAVMDQIHALSAEYRAVQSMDDPVYSSEYDEEIQFEIDEIVKILQGANSDEVGTLNMASAKIRELNNEELQKVYNILKYINWSMKTAKDMMSSGQFRSVYDAMTSIVEQQRALRSAAGMGWLGRTKRSRMLDSLNVMRAVEMMSNWDRNAALYQIMHQVEQGVVKSDAWVMDYNKSLQELKTGKNEKAYRDALTKKLDYSVTDEEGLPVKMTKMQAIQILMTAEREAGNDKLVHLQKGGAVIRDALKIQDGKTDKAGGQTIQITPELLQRIQDSLTEWDRAYMKAVRAYLAKEGKATNQVMYALKHRVLETEPNYVPYIVDKNYLDTDLNEKQAMNMWVKTPGSTNALKQKASQPVIIDGMDTVMAKHVKEIADYIGMALPIRDFSKVYNGKLKQSEGKNPLPVKKLIDRNWEKKGLHLLTQSIIDVQGGSRSNSWSTAIAEHLNALQSAFVKSALLINPSVTIKQAASYTAAGSILSHRALDRANHPVSVKTDKSNAFDPATGLIGHIFMAPNGKTATRIYNEIDKYTSMHYLRRQGMSQYELANEANRNGPVRRRVNAAGARMEQNVFGHAARKVGASLNPVSWIQRMDVATTATLWLACKEQARMDGLTVNSQEYWQRTTELYERVLRETQPMYDSLHRNAFQKGQGLFQYLFPFRTVPIQNHGQLAAAVETWMASKNKSTAEKKEAAKFLRKTAFAQTESAIVFSLMTFIAAALKRKTKKYRDEDEELGLGSVIKGIGTDTAGTLFSVLMPVAGSELWNIGSRLAGKFDGSSGYTYDAFSVGVVDLLNDLAGSFDKIAEDLGKLHRGEDASEFWSHGLTMLLKATKMAGIPADTVKTYWQGIRGNVEDALDGRLPALNDESWERSEAVNAERYVKALEAGNSEKVDQVEAEMLQDYADAGKSKEEAEKALKTKLTSTLKEKYEGGSIEAQDAVDLLVETGFYDENDAWKKVKEWEVKAEHKGETDYHYSQYDELYAAMDQNGDVSGIVKDLTDHGVDPDSVKSAAKGHLIDRYMAGEINSTQVKNQLSRYCGIVGTDATNLVRWLDLRKAKPGLEVTQAQCNAWYDGSKKTQENGHESAKAAGMSIEAYLEAKAVLDEIKDSNDNGTGEDEVIEALAKMKLTSRQKDALYYERYKGTTKYSVKKW